jgi:hypothetical protein
MNFKSEQELYDYIGTFLIKQGKQSKNGDGCIYRGPNGTKCAVGCVISDHYYRKRMDNDGYSALEMIKSFKLPKFFHKFDKFLDDAQNVHDNNLNWKDGILSFKKAWHFFGLYRNLDVSKFK